MHSIEALWLDFRVFATVEIRDDRVVHAETMQVPDHGHTSSHLQDSASIRDIPEVRSHIRVVREHRARVLHQRGDVRGLRARRGAHVEHAFAGLWRERHHRE